jgi:hypothetical protein
MGRYVAFLMEKPSAAARKKALALATDEDLKAIDAVLGAGTIRTMGTIEQIAAKYC